MTPHTSLAGPHPAPPACLPPPAALSPRCRLGCPRDGQAGRCLSSEAAVFVGGLPSPPLPLQAWIRVGVGQAWEFYSWGLTMQLPQSVGPRPWAALGP